MSKSAYNSISISLDDSRHWKAPSYEYDLSGNSKTAPREINVRVSPISVVNDSTALTSMGYDEDHDHKHVVKQQTWSMGSILLSTLVVGFSIGFSVGYISSKRVPFRMNALGGAEVLPPLDDIGIGDRLGEEAMKVMRFMDDFLFRDSKAIAQESNPLMRFSFQAPTSVKRPLIYLNRPDAYALLMDASPLIDTISQYSNDFFLISSGMDAQINQAYCGTATAVAILNSLRFIKSADGDDGVDIPIDDVYNPYPYATQADVFNACTQQTVISQTGGGPGVDGILTPPYGLSMDQIAALLQCHLHTSTSGDWKITSQFVDSTHQTVGKMRFDLKNSLSDPNSRVLVNYDRSAVGQIGGGHWSPIGSYSEKQDAFLVLDVAKYKYPPVWIPTVSKLYCTNCTSCYVGKVYCANKILPLSRNAYLTGWQRRMHADIGTIQMGKMF